MATSFDPDDIDAFLAEINREVGDINPEITIDLKYKTVHCYLCKETKKVPRIFHLDETCQECFINLREHYFKVHHINRP